MRRWLFTGCAGFIASHLVEAQLDAGNDVVGIDAFSDFNARDVKTAMAASAAPGVGYLRRVIAMVVR